jgi:hypothetical protein
VTPEDFMSEHQPVLLSTLRKYLSEEIPHSDASECAWSIIDAWAESDIDPESAYATGERVLWGAVWALQHLADEEHWSDGVTQRDLSPYLELIASRGDSPECRDARRPTGP